jgi:anti-anti-sigma factor
MDGGRVDERRVDDGVSIDLDRRDGVVVLRVRGEVDMANATDTSTRLLSASGDGSSIVLDLGELTYIDSAGIRMLFDLSEQLARDQRRLVLAVGHDAPVRRALEITKLDTLVAVASSLTAAVEAATP